MSVDIAKKIISSGIERVAIGIYCPDDIQLLNNLSSELGKSVRNTKCIKVIQ